MREGGADIQQRQRIHQKMHEIIPTHRFAQIQRQQERCVPINVYKRPLMPSWPLLL